MVASALKAPTPFPVAIGQGQSVLIPKSQGRERLHWVSLPKVCPSPRSWEPGQGGPSHTVTVPVPAVFPRKKVGGGGEMGFSSRKSIHLLGCRA